MIAALYVETGGCYFGIDGVDPWDQARDARLYEGPHPVVAHPPCERWGRYWSGGPSARVRRKLGDDAGCFASALAAVRKFGGVLEHPEASHAWNRHGISAPPRAGGWISVDGGWSCCVEQGSYGHFARKATWLYAVGVELPVLRWRATGEFVKLDLGYHSTAQRRADRAAGVAPPCRLSARQRRATPIAFRDLLLSMARTVPLFGGFDVPVG